MRIILTALVVLAVTACASTVSRGMPNSFSTPNVGGPYEMFPRDGSVTTDAALCTLDSGPDSTLMYQEAITSSRFVRAVSLRLPTMYVKYHDVLPVPPRAEDAGGIHIATWTVAGWSLGPARKAPGVHMWVDPRRNVPTVGAEPGTTQTAYAECSGITVDGRPAEVVVFTLMPGSDAVMQEPRSYLSAFWPAPGGRYLQFLASAPDRAGLAPFHRALLDLKVTGR
jgi:hypothetical protein